ncbi:SGNH hydrolase-type esterase superfamily protein [Artemisia annua]|uniref:SGNH hydrolase-type esterase superfamily protein n=1 Tax=Artemisia annua TaxID=35608 RepID=A0A2U1MDZ9_ARTAN|nr:SGNH hydrolase-type esterase superfamily protein [Artemisia annua]
MRPSIVLFGDSITEQSFQYGGWGASLTDTYSRKADIVIRGYSGYTTRWALLLLHHLFPAGSTTPPVAATVFFGANDAALKGRTSENQHVPLEEYKENLRKIVRHLKECSPAMLIVLITPPPIDEEGRLLDAVSSYGEKAMKLPERTNEAAGDHANGCIEVAKEVGVSSINLWSKMQETEGWQKKFLNDGLHLTPDGNRFVYEEVLKVFNGASLTAPDMPSDFPHHSEIDHHNPEKVFQERGL